MQTLTSITHWLILGAALLGCGDEGILLAEVIASARQGNGSNPPYAPTPVDDAPVASAPPDEMDPVPAAPTAQEVLSANCGMCHRPDLPENGFFDITDVDALIAADLIVPGNPQDSPILTRMLAGQMPPVSAGLRPVSAADIQIVSDFIVSLAPESEPIEAALEEILTSYCGECHTGSSLTAAGGLDVIDDVDALIERGLIVPGSRLDSAVYGRIAQGSMPPAFYLPRVSDSDLERIGRFIDAL
jgi:mono/diheme cytochrome c family protein